LDLVEEYVEDVDDGWGDEEETIGGGGGKKEDDIDGIVEDDLEMADVTTMSMTGGAAGDAAAVASEEGGEQEGSGGAGEGAGEEGAVASVQEATSGKEDAPRSTPVEELVVDTSVANLSANPQSTTPAVTALTPDQCTIKVTWKKNSADEPSSKEAIIAVFSEFGNVKKVGIKESSDAKKSKSALVVFDASESVRKAIDGYKGSWKVKAYATSGDGAAAGAGAGEQPGSTKSATSTASTPKSTKSSSSAKSSKVVDSMFERSIKISWKNSSSNQPPTNNELKQAFAKYGTVSKLMPTDKEPYAVILFQNAEEALYAARNYGGELGAGVKVKLLKDGNAASPGSNSRTQTVKVSPKKKSPASTPSTSPRLAPLKTTPTAAAKLALYQQQVAPPSDSSFESAMSAAQKMLQMGSTSANSSPMADSYNRVELRAKEQKSALIIEKLMSRNESNEAALARAMEQIQELTRELSGVNQREVMSSTAKSMEEHEWASENMSLKVQLKETEKSEGEARKELIELKQEVQVMKAELHSVERTSRTIEIVQEKAYERAQREVGAKLLMQENR
jgi:hypothetical protein